MTDTTEGRRSERLTAERIVDAALELVARDGLATLSTRAIGGALGVKAMAIYHYFPSMDALLDALAERIIRSVEIPPRSGGLRADLMALQTAYVAAAKRHPRAIPLLAGRRFNTVGTLPFLDAIFAVMRDAGFGPQETAAAFRIQGYFINGALMAFAATFEADARTDFRLNDAAFLAPWPHVAEVLPHLRSGELDRIFAAGMALILDGIERA